MGAQRCIAGGGSCEWWIDGYFIELFLSVLVGICLFPWTVRTVRGLSALPRSAFVPAHVRKRLQRHSSTPGSSHSLTPSPSASPTSPQTPTSSPSTSSAGPASSSSLSTPPVQDQMPMQNSTPSSFPGLTSSPQEGTETKDTRSRTDFLSTNASVIKQ